MGTRRTRAGSVRSGRRPSKASPPLPLVPVFDAFFAQAVSCVALIARDGRFVRVNDAYAAYYGRRADELVGASVLDLTSTPEEREASWATIESVARTAQPLLLPDNPYRFPGQPERGTTYWDIVLQPLVGDDGEVASFLFTSRDVTARVRAQEALRDREQQVTRLNEELERRVEERTAQLRRANQELQDALGRVKQLEGIIPICMYCKKVRVDPGSWDRIEKYVTEHTNATFSHGICPECLPRAEEPEVRGGGEPSTS